MKLPAFRTFFLMTVATACVETELTYTSDDHEIVNGLPTTGYPSVVRVFGAGVTNPGPDTPSCTGVLITSSSVLTTAHCVTNYGWHVTDVFSGTAVVHPAYDPLSKTNDLAVISTLDKVNRPWHARMAANVAPQLAITLVGYGQTGSNIPQDGIKRFGRNTIDRLDPHFFYYDTDLTTPAPKEAATCKGDSGGPAFLGNSDCVGGITQGQLSTTSTTECTAGGGEWRHIRVDRHVAWLESVTRDSLSVCP